MADLFRIASVGLIEDPHAPSTGDDTLFGGAAGGGKMPTDAYFDKYRSFYEEYGFWPRLKPATIHVRAEDLDLAVHAEPGAFFSASPILKLPKHERRQFAVSSVRQWFRKMRAADFDRDRLPHLARRGVAGVDVWGTSADSDAHLDGLRRHWTLFDTQQVVDRETASHYEKPDDDAFTIFGFPVVWHGMDWGSDPSYVAKLLLLPGERERLVVGKWDDSEPPVMTDYTVTHSTRVDYAKPGDPDYVRRDYRGANLLQDITTCHERGGQPEWDHTDYSRDCTWLGLDRSTFPQFSSKVQSSGDPVFTREHLERVVREAMPPARGITIEDIGTFVREDDAHRSERVKPTITLKDSDHRGSFYYDVPNTREVTMWLAGVESCEWADWPAYFARRPWDVVNRKAIMKRESSLDHLAGGGILGGCGEW